MSNHELYKALHYCGRLGFVMVLLLLVITQTNINFQGFTYSGKVTSQKILMTEREHSVIHEDLRYRVIAEESSPEASNVTLEKEIQLSIKTVHPKAIGTENHSKPPPINLQGKNPPSERQRKRKSKTTACNQGLRQKVLKDSCKYYRKKGEETTLQIKLTDDYTYANLLVVDSHKVMYCEIPKVACTSWKVFLAKLSGKVESKDYKKLHELVHDTRYYPKVGFKYLNQYNTTERDYRLKNYFKFLVVRDPIARLVSAYENKLVKVTDQSKFYQDNVGTYIIKKYRENPSNKSLADGMDARLEELVQLILDNTVQFDYRYDLHWWKMQSMCFPCLFNYDYIAKLETFEQDLDFLLNKIAPGKRPEFPYLNSNSGQKMQITIDKYFNRLSMELKERIKTFYEMDRNMFGYAIDNNVKECD